MTFHSTWKLESWIIRKKKIRRILFGEKKFLCFHWYWKKSISEKGIHSKRKIVKNMHKRNGFWRQSLILFFKSVYFTCSLFKCEQSELCIWSFLDPRVSEANGTVQTYFFKATWNLCSFKIFLQVKIKCFSVLVRSFIKVSHSNIMALFYTFFSSTFSLCYRKHCILSSTSPNVITNFTRWIRARWNYKICFEWTSVLSIWIEDLYSWTTNIYVYYRRSKR